MSRHDYRTNDEHSAGRFARHDAEPLDGPDPDEYADLNREPARVVCGCERVGCLPCAAARVMGRWGQ